MKNTVFTLFTLLLCLVKVTNAFASTPIPCEQCTHVVNGWKTDGDALNIQPGDTICMKGYMGYNLLFESIEGTEAEPVIITNCDGEVAFVNPTGSAYGIKFTYSSHFKLIGNGGGGDYGIKVSTDNGFFVSLQTYTTNFEIANVEIAGKTTAGSGFAGIGVKTSPYEDCDAFTNEDRTQSWIMRDITIRDNYIHDTDGEGLYIGHGFYTGRTESSCTVKTYSHSIKGVRVHDNIIKNVGYDGIQIKNCDEDVEVYNNLIDGYGTMDNGAHDEGLYIGGGTTGLFYNNMIMNGGTGIMIHAMGNNDIFNNVIINATDYALFAAEGPTVYRIPDGYFNIFNNTFHTTGDRAFAFFGVNGGIKRLKNNIIVAPFATELVRKGVPIDSCNNIIVTSLAFVKFADFNNNDLTLDVASPAVDAGIDVSGFGVMDDVDGNLRNTGNYDIGAYELTFSNGILAVELKRFEAQSSDCAVAIQWEDANSTDFEAYELEWSPNGNDFYSKTTQLHDEYNSNAFEYLDEQAKHGDNYYRLKMIDLDGTYSYSEVIAQRLDCTPSDKMLVFPNPVNQNELTIQFVPLYEQEQVQVFDMTGKVLLTKDINTEPSTSNTITLDVSDLANGSYMLNLVGQPVVKAFNVLK